MTKQEIIDYMYENHVQGDFKIEEMAEDLSQPEIIRCKDCKHWVIHKSLNIPWCRCLFSGMGADDYCSYAKLRGDSDE